MDRILGKSPKRGKNPNQTPIQRQRPLIGIWRLESGIFPLTPPWLLSILFRLMRDKITLECTEAKAEGKPVSRYISTRNKKLQTERLQVKKYNPNLRRHTLHKEVK
jgi:large subunit ribosomal protein L33